MRRDQVVPTERLPDTCQLLCEMLAAMHLMNATLRDRLVQSTQIDDVRSTLQSWNDFQINLSAAFEVQFQNIQQGGKFESARDGLIEAVTGMFDRAGNAPSNNTKQ